MSAWMVRQWQAQRDRIALGIIVGGAIANVAWIAVGAWLIATGIGQALLFIADRLR